MQFFSVAYFFSILFCKYFLFIVFNCKVSNFYLLFFFFFFFFFFYLISQKNPRIKWLKVVFLPLFNNENIIQLKTAD
ncbi:hypothetical protein O3M35_001703 [Rhynocoris fuscipes]|uniref:ATP synthase F0 subunit 8 n=1 Tax=Rhynocoris fuscipes TaxID=488301 RepID=A0AAW1CRR8_9HEMI